jgi:xanthine dehydrogenase molybdopterin-binding subunit B
LQVISDVITLVTPVEWLAVSGSEANGPAAALAAREIKASLESLAAR